jgi:hypothetical protein
MFMGMSAGVIALSIAGGATLENLFAFYSKISLVTLLFIAFMTAVFILLTYLTLRYFTLLLSLLADGKNSRSSRRTS